MFPFRLPGSCRKPDEPSKSPGNVVSLIGYPDSSLISKQSRSAHQDLRGEPADEPQRESLEVVVLEEVVEAQAVQLEADAQVAAEVEAVVHDHHVTLLPCVFLLWVR